MGRPSYCSRSCCGKDIARNFGDRKNNVLPPKRITNPFNYYIRNCKRRHQHDFNLTLNDLKEIWDNQQGICPYSKVKLHLNTHSLRNPDIRFNASLDRIDSSKGYIKGNVQFVSTVINYMKSTMSHNHTIEFLQIITKNLSPLLS